MTQRFDTSLIKIAGATIDVQQTAYADGDLVGTGAIEIANAVRTGGGSGMLVSVVLQDLTKQDAALDVILFDANPTGTTFTNNSALDIADADITKIIGHVSVAASDYTDFNDNSVATKTQIALPVEASGTDNTSLYFCLISNSATPTYAQNELSAVFGFLQD